MPIDIIVFLLIAVFLIFRLGSVLGKRTGHQKPADFLRRQQEDSGERREENVVHLPNQQHAEGGPESPAFTGPAGEGLRAIRDADPDFDPDQFLEGARAAFDMIVNAFAQGDQATLKQLLDEPTYESFATAIRERERNMQRMEDTLIGIDDAEIEEAELRGGVARVTVRFDSKQVNVLYDQDDQVVEGDPQKVIEVTDIWTFARDTRSDDPNWQLVETRSG